MIPALLAGIGLPLLSKALGQALTRIDHPVARTAADALAAVGAAVEAKAITPEQLSEANRHMERMAELESDEAKLALTQINQTMRSEMSGSDAYVRRWRPTFGYAVAATWSAQMGAVSWAIVTDPAASVAIINALVSTSPIWGVALGVLGVAVVKRSQDKAAAAPRR